MSATPEFRTTGEMAPPPPNVLVFTDAAAGKVGELIREEANPNLKLRVFVSGGGCSGFQYGFTFDEKIEDGDFCVENHGSIFLLQPLSPAANDWIQENLPEDRLTFGGAVAVEHRYIADIVRGAQHDGLVIR